MDIFETDENQENFGSEHNYTVQIPKWVKNFNRPRWLEKREYIKKEIMYLLEQDHTIMRYSQIYHNRTLLRHKMCRQTFENFGFDTDPDIQFAILSRQEEKRFEMLDYWMSPEAAPQLQIKAYCLIAPREEQDIINPIKRVESTNLALTGSSQDIDIRQVQDIREKLKCLTDKFSGNSDSVIEIEG